MCCRITDMRQKQVVCIKSGTLLGTVGDVEVNTCDGKIVNIVVFGKARCFGLLGKEEDIILPWNCIEVIGRDAMLVNFEPPFRQGRKKGLFSSLFSSNYMN